MKKTLFTIITIVLITVGCAKQKGCTEPNAINYDTAAEENDGTCVYSSSNYTTSTNTGSTSTNTGSTTTNTSNTSSNTTNQNNLLGQVDITASWEMRSIIGSNICVNAYSITIGISGSSEGTFYSSPCTYRRKDLQPGTYSYTLKKSFSEAACGSGQGVPADVIKSGSFTIVAGEIETVSVGYIN